MLPLMLERRVFELDCPEKLIFLVGKGRERTMQEFRCDFFVQFLPVMGCCCFIYVDGNSTWLYFNILNV